MDSEDEHGVALPLPTDVDVPNRRGELEQLV